MHTQPSVCCGHFLHFCHTISSQREISLQECCKFCKVLAHYVSAPACTTYYFHITVCNFLVSKYPVTNLVKSILVNKFSASCNYCEYEFFLNFILFPPLFIFMNTIKMEFVYKRPKCLYTYQGRCEFSHSHQHFLMFSVNTFISLHNLFICWI